MAKKNKIFANGIEYKFYQTYRMYPEEMHWHLQEKGHDNESAWNIVQMILNNIWEHEKQMERYRQKQEEEWEQKFAMASEINPFTGCLT